MPLWVMYLIFSLIMAGSSGFALGVGSNYHASTAYGFAVFFGLMSVGQFVLAAAYIVRESILEGKNAE